MALISPGVEVNVIDESFYTPAGTGTVPMIFVATAQDKSNSSRTGIATGTLKSNAGRPYLLTSQRELGEVFGDPVFYTDDAGNPIHGSELNEYGLQTAYSLLGVSNRVYVTRADFDLAKLQPSATAPGGEPVDGSYWFDTQVTQFGVLEWNASPVTTTGGQSFSVITPIVITQTGDVVDYANADYTPKDSIGAVGDYAVVAVTTTNRLWYRNNSGTWVQVGSATWKTSWPTVASDGAPATVTSSGSFTLNGSTVNYTNGQTLADVANTINGLSISGGAVTAAVVNGELEIYTSGDSVIVAGAGASTLGLVAGTYASPAVSVAPHTQVPQYKTADTTPRPTGSLWIKTTQPNGGAVFRVKRYNSDTRLWEIIAAPVYTSNETAIYNLDRSSGGTNLRVGDLYVRVNVEADADPLGTWKIYRRSTTGATSITSAKINSQLDGGTNSTFTMAETLAGQSSYASAKTITFDALGNTGDADRMAGAINGAGFTNIRASVDSQNRVVITHTAGGEIKLVDTDGQLNLAGFKVFVSTDPTSTTNLAYAPGTDANTSPAQFVASIWRVLDYTASDNEPTTLAADGELWYNSVVDEIDILVHDGNNWAGYGTSTSPYYDIGSGAQVTDPNGPIVRATRPTTQSDGTPLVNGDLWVDTSDLENFPTLYRYSDAPVNDWIQLDITDQTTENGILFADARWSTAGANSEAADITDLLTSNYLDPDAPDPALYPRGMLLWNLRRSGFNVKRFVRDYIDTDSDNIRGSDEGNSMESYYPHRWVTESGNNVDGSGTFGRNAQRKSVVQALQSMINSNQDIRDEEIRQFNLMATPGYPELIGEMISLNYERRLTAFVVGDTPLRLEPNATSLNTWASNANLATEDNDLGAVSFDEYMAMYYPAGLTSDNAGNNVVVPPSHMALRTLVLNDQIAYPWFAPAGTRRGGVTNASSSGYINSEGEFRTFALNTGQRDTLYTNNINPITFVNGSGLLVFGQKTRARNASALDRINVSRLVVYLRGQLERIVRPYLFEPNDKITRDQVKNSVDVFLLELLGLRALNDFLVVCDESNNTPSRIDRNEMHVDIAIEPLRAVEFIYIPLRIKNTGEIQELT